MHRWRKAGLAVLWLCIASAVRAEAPEAPPGGGEDLSNLTIEQLAQIQVRSASKRDQPLSEAPAALYVIDHDQIVRSGAVTIPEMLRLAPNLQVYQRTPAEWVVTARGLNGSPSLQSFSNKLLVLIDGRSVYAPHFSGVYWDLPDLIPDDIEQIEVISGPGATLWGANAVNGSSTSLPARRHRQRAFWWMCKPAAYSRPRGWRSGPLGRDLNYRF